jgi:hypothetical protein
MPPKLPVPEFAIGDRVCVVLNERNRTPHTGTIRYFVWHFDERRYYFFLQEGRRKISKRYAAEDLKKLSD